EPQAALGGHTPLQAAYTPHMNRLARQGVVGRSNNVPPTLTPASDVATLSLFGYDPLVVYTGRAPLECAAQGLPLGPDDWAVRCNLVTVEDGQMRDFTAGHITNDDGRALMAVVQEQLGGTFIPEEAGLKSVRVDFEFHAGVSYRNLFLVRSHGVPA